MAKRRNRAQKVNAAPATKAAARQPARKTKARKAIKVTAETVVEPIVAVQVTPVVPEPVVPVFVRKPDRFEKAINVMADFLTMIENYIRALLVKAA